ncbi:helix-turn-helix domain-containing protein [Prochlorothrix hollandica]|uniref:Cytoskeleton protein RodZ-like C-terminal domain-containing protein n=1 Tax=Prochlorothrix hollandica PCC 9006 = CALU 1027 TaxID=317619 RepID=A0A0M2PYL4_PROHO|nr:RodZ domain-containing protein [Prochlorothrix hollandica]KKI99773.1 hypothetical protein PROH_07865 [Prochlorothrix hollandica PCC 9006 = CALU 1027]
MRKRQKPSAVQLDQIQAEQIQAIGAYLRQHREHLRMSLDQVASLTKIQRRLLQAIENGHLATLPEPVYIQALIHRFGDALDLKGSELADQFPLELTPHRSGRLQFNWSVGQLRPMHLYLFYIFVIFSAVNGLSVMMSRSLTQLQPSPASLLLLNPEVSPLQSSSSVPTVGIAGAIPEELVALVRQAFPLHAHDSPNASAWVSHSTQLVAQLPEPSLQSTTPVSVKLTLETQSWLRVMVDGKTTFEGMMLAGSQRSWQAQEEITVRAGNAGAVLVTFNDGPSQPMGDVGAVEEKTYTPDAVTGPTLALLPESRGE